jgi:S-formylglutathione hydrolase FrmB
LDQQAIVAMPDGGLGSLWVDWRDGRFQDETRFIHEIVPTIEGRYRTYGDRAHRAVAGFSAGGFSATYLAARHPDIFAAYAGISGIVEMSETDAFTGPVYGPLAGLAGTAASGVPGASGPFGHPGVDSIWWHNANPIDLAPNLGGVDVTIFTGNGVPCDARDLAEASSTLPPFTLGEPLIRKWAMDLDRALTSANVTHTLDDYSGVTGCGVHTYRYAERDIHVWWNPLLASFGSQPPSSFDYRRADPVFSVWGWTLTSETTRAAEFLDVTDASASGVTLTGSGVETVTTAGYFAPGSVLALTGAVEQIASADDAGRIMFHVDLGPAHEFEQYTPQQRIFEALGGYWTTRIVSFELM